MEKMRLEWEKHREKLNKEYVKKLFYKRSMQKNVRYLMPMKEEFFGVGEIADILNTADLIADIVLKN